MRKITLPMSGVRVFNVRFFSQAGIMLLVLLVPLFAQTGRVHALFSLESPTGGPFPSDVFTVEDSSQNTGLRVNLPKPDCIQRPSDCEDLDVINTLDGFNVQPRLSIPFDGAIDVYSVTSDTVFLIKLVCRDDGPEQCNGDGGRPPETVGINQIVWDTFTNMLHVESDELLEQHTRYALIVTRGVRDSSWMPVEAALAFRNFRQTARAPYKQDLLDAIHMARKLGIPEREIAVASVFTTQSVTAILEKIRDQIKASTPAPADFKLGSGGSRTVFNLEGVTGVTWTQQLRTNPPVFNTIPIDLSVPRFIPGAVGRIAFGKYVSPDYTVHPGEYIPTLGTRTGTPRVLSTAEVYFNLFLPSGTPPPKGWPVAIIGHGGGANKNVFPTFLAATLASHGVSTIAINVVGHGFGPLGTLTVSQTGGITTTLPAGGRGIDQNGDGLIDPREGIRAASPRTVIDDRDGFRQTVADLMQLVRVIEVGLDVDGDGLQDLDPSRIYYVGQSLGGIYGADFLAIEPNVRTGVLTVAGGPRTMRALTARGDRAFYGGVLAARVPSLINFPGVTEVDGVPVPSLPLFNENMPLRDSVPLDLRLADGTSYSTQSPMVNTLPGAVSIQEFFEHTEWVMQAANPVAYAPYLRKTPLAGLQEKSLLLQFALGDQAVPNPATTAMVRAGDLADRTTYYRNDLAVAEDPNVPKVGHGFMPMINNPVPLAAAIARGAQEQIGVFLASDGALLIHPEPSRFFEVPIAGPLPESLNYIP
jgi:pimeloyl-ACP methyl ester carboxylesterase